MQSAYQPDNNRAYGSDRVGNAYAILRLNRSTDGELRNLCILNRCQGAVQLICPHPNPSPQGERLPVPLPSTPG